MNLRRPSPPARRARGVGEAARARGSGRAARARDVQGGLRLSDLAPGQSATVVRLASRSAARMGRLSVLGVVPGARVTLQQRRPAFVVHVGFTELSLERRVADEIMVSPD